MEFLEGHGQFLVGGFVAVTEIRKTTEEINESLSHCPAIGTRWRHKKSGNVYYIITCAAREEDCEPLVIYKRWGLTTLHPKAPNFARPLSLWHERYEAMFPGEGAGL